jgi:hypothetical protein
MAPQCAIAGGEALTLCANKPKKTDFLVVLTVIFVFLYCVLACERVLVVLLVVATSSYYERGPPWKKAQASSRTEHLEVLMRRI